MTEELHRAIQYLCAAGKSYCEHKPDDSHTASLWNSELKAMTSQPLGQFGDYHLALNFPAYSLEILNHRLELVESLHLEGVSHLAVVNWIGEQGVEKGIGDLYAFDLHYELPYGKIEEDYIFPEPDYNEIERLTDLRDLADAAMSHLLEVFSVSSPVLVWPHHFDTGAVIPLNLDGTASIGIGLAIADSMVEEEYFYVSGWSQNENLVLDYMPELEQGKWLFPDWNGAVLSANGISDKEAMSFLLLAARAVQDRAELML